MATEGEYRTRSTTRDEPSFADDGPLAALFAPPLLAGLAAAEDHTTHAAGYGLYLLARADADAAPALAEPLAERLAADERRRDLCRTLASLRLVDDEAVRDALLATAPRDRARRLYAVVRETDPWAPPDSLPAEGDHAEYLTTFRQLIQPEDDEPTPEDHSVTDVLEDEGDDVGDEETSEEERAKRSTRRDDADGETRRDRIEGLAESDLFRTLVHRSGFDDLQVVTPPRERRFADAFRARARADDTERGVAVRLLHAEDGTDGALADALASWARLVEASGIVTVVDWGTTPQPWVATECLDGRLAGSGGLDPAAALRGARVLSGALVELHQQDVVHAGIDPHSVVYTSSFEGDERPMLDNVGLLGALSPGEHLDPRYAAPEYFDDGYGRIDHSTDIYQLGMVIYRLFASRHPYDGDYDAVREGVLKGRPPAPSECTPALPDAVDEVVAKATARQKLTRYETANGLHADIVRICESVLD